MWYCQTCHEKIEDALDTCWNCGTAKDEDGTPDPTFRRADDPVLDMKQWTSNAASSATAPPLDSYEFGPKENDLISDLARKMRFVGMILVVVGVLSALSGIVTLNTEGLGHLFSGVIYVVVGSWTRRAAASFRRIVESQGGDIRNLMDALGNLKSVYTLKYWLGMIAVGVLVVGLVFMVAG